MNDYDREIGRIEEGIKHLNKRYDAQEVRLSRLEDNLSEIRGMIIGEPANLLKIMEAKFVTKEQLKPIESTYNLIKKASIYIFVVVLGGVAVAIEYIRRLP